MAKLYLQMEGPRANLAFATGKSPFATLGSDFLSCRSSLPVCNIELLIVPSLVPLCFCPLNILPILHLDLLPFLRELLHARGRGSYLLCPLLGAQPLTPHRPSIRICRMNEVRGID